MGPPLKSFSIWVVILVFLHTSLALKADPVPAQRRAELQQRDPAPQRELPSTAQGSRRPAVGTKDAPVDGADGKPHAGPFVESTGDSGTKTKVKEEKEKPSPEDGVMNDPHRPPPKQGTTGTEGGVSEKSREREKHEEQTGRRKVQRPESPKEPGSTSLKDSAQSDAREGNSKKESISESGTGSERKKVEKIKDVPVPGLEVSTVSAIHCLIHRYLQPETKKPEDLPPRPHDIPPPEPPSKQKSTSKNTYADLKSSTKPPATTTADEDTDSDTELPEGVHDLIRWDSLFGSFSSIAATEIGDKTFIVAALMAMRHPRLQVFTAAFAALALMTVLSGVTGHAVGALISKRWAALVAALLFLAFGLKSLKEGLDMAPDAGVGDEMREVQAELEEKEGRLASGAAALGHRKISSISPDVLESGRAQHRERSRGRMTAALKRNPSVSSSQEGSPSHAHAAGPGRSPLASAAGGIRNLLALLLSPAWVETFSMTFVGELGDRSQIATVAMAAGQEYFWIMVGATLGHFVCTAGAVLGGSVLAGRVSMRKGMFVLGFFILVYSLLQRRAVLLTFLAIA